MKFRRSTRRSRQKYPAVAEPLEIRRLLAADLVISEFMASNSDGIQDQYGNYSDWIEIHNAGDADANLNDYFLTDNAGNPEEWRFPVQTLAAGAYLVVFADGMNNAVAGQELDTNFKLAAAGEYLALINAADDSVAFAYSPEYPQQTANISYGLSDSDDPNSPDVYFSVPTPGEPNALSVAEPAFSTAGTVFTGTLTLTLSDTTSGSTIYYTTNDSSPTTSSTVYTGPISLTASTPIRTFATASGYVSSPVTSQTYERVDSTVTSVQNQNLPVIIIDTYGGTMSEASDSDIPGSATVMNTTNGTTNILGTADYQGRIGIHIRGSTSESYPKQQYLLDIWDENDNGKNVSLLGMPADSSWVLYAPYTELSLMQNPLAYQWANEMGEYASRTQFVELYMSTGGNSYAGNTSTISYSSNYMGVYILEEKIQIDSNRVNVDEVSASNPGGGYIVDQDRYTGDNYFTTPQGVHLDYTDPDDTSLDSDISSSWDAFENALFTGSAGPNQPWDTPGNADYYGNYINIPSFVDYFLLEEMTKNTDAFWLSTYYNKASDTTVNGVTTRGLISAGPVWDFNLSLGTANYQDSADADGWDTYQLSPYSGAAGVSGFNPQDPYFQRLLTDPNFVQDLTNRWDQLRQGIFSTANLDADIQANVNLLSDNTGVYPVGINPTGTTSPLMRNFQKWPELGVYVTTDSNYDPGGSWIKDVDIMESWLTARVNWMDSQFTPEPTVTPGGDFAGPTTITMSPVGSATTNDTVLLASSASYHYLAATSSSNLNNWYLPSYTYSTSPAWSTGNAGFGYSTSSNDVNYSPYITTNVQSIMLNKANSLYMRTTFAISNPSSIEALIFEARYDDGFILWINGVRVMDANSPENINPAWNTAAAGSGNDNLAITYRSFDISSVLPLLIAGTNTIAIQVLNSGTGSSDLLMEPQLLERTYSYPATGTIYYTTNGTDPMGSNGLPSASALVYNGALSLSTSTEIEARTYNPGTTDPFDTYTGQSSTLAWSGLSDQVYDFQSGNLRITELMYDPPAGGAYSAQEYEFVELQNVSSVPLNLNGYAFTNGIDFTFPNETLAPGAYGVVVKDAAAFASRYGSSPNVLGSYSDSFNNAGEKVELDDGFGQEVESFTYQKTWYPSTYGGGTSLVVVDPAEDDATLGTAAGWEASATNDGSPGYANSDSTTPTVTSLSVNDGGAGSPTVQFTFNTYISSGSSGTFTVVSKQTGQSVAVSGFTVDGDVLTLSLPSTLASGAYQLTLPAGAVENASAIVNSTSTIDTILLIRAGQTWSLPPAETGLVVNSLVFGAGGTLDVGNSTLSVQYSNAADPAGTIAQLIATGYNNGTWTGTGITSANAAADTSATTGVGYFDDGTEVKIARTWYGDANLDGQINADDLSLMLLGQENNGTRWQDGNFNYDSQIDQDDWSKLMYALAYSGGQPLSQSNVTIAAVSSADTTSASTNARLANNLRAPAFGITPITVADETNDLLDTPQTVL
jgi:hypothetical protein